MSVDRRSTRIYAWFIRLYPTAFRKEYGESLVDLFDEQLSDTSNSRVWLRTTRDLIVTIPTQHLEARMTRPNPNTLAVIAGVFAIAATLLGFVVGFSPIALPILLVAVLAGSVAVMSWTNNHGTLPTPETSGLWWKFALAGVALVGGLLAAIAIPWPDSMDIGDTAWMVGALVFCAGIVCFGISAILGLAAFIGHRARNASAS